MREYLVTIEEDHHGSRLDSVLSLLIEEASRSYIQKLIAGGNVKLEDGAVLNTKKYLVSSGQRIFIQIPEPQELDIRAENIPLDIVYEDAHLIVVNKPKGMVVHPASGNYTGTLVNGLLYHCKDLSGINGTARPGIVHRIDKDTTGLLMVAKSDIAHVSLSEQLKAHSIDRLYHAIVFHNFSEETGTIEGPIGRDPNNRLRMAVTDRNSKEAVTHYRVLQRFGNFTYVEVKLETGRTHQIRVHMANRNHPLLGDHLYGPKKHPFGVKTQMLHAKTLGLIHPVSKEYLSFDSQLPYEFQEVLQKLGGKQ